MSKVTQLLSRAIIRSSLSNSKALAFSTSWGFCPLYLFSQVAAILDFANVLPKSLLMPLLSSPKKREFLHSFCHILQGIFNLIIRSKKHLGSSFHSFFLKFGRWRKGSIAGWEGKIKTKTQTLFPPPRSFGNTAASFSPNSRRVGYSRYVLLRGRQCSQDWGEGSHRINMAYVTLTPEFGRKRVVLLINSNHYRWYQMQKSHEFLGWLSRLHTDSGSLPLGSQGYEDLPGPLQGYSSGNLWGLRLEEDRR